MSQILFERTINNLHDNGKITFKKLKEMLSEVSSFVLEKKDVPKGKKILLSYSVKENKLLIAEKKTEVKDNNKTINEYIKTCENLKEEISFILNNLEKNINSLNQDDQESIFGPEANVYYNLELINKPEKCNSYNTKHFNIMPDGHGEYDKSGKLIISEVSRQINKLEEYLKNWDDKLKYEVYNKEVNSFKKLKELNDKSYYNYADNRLDNCLWSVNSYINNDKFNLSDESTIDEYILSRIYILLNAILDKSGNKPVDPIAKMNIAKRLLGIKGIGLQDISKKLDNEQEKYIKENILDDKNKKELLKNAIKPIEDIIINYSLDMLKAIQSILVLTNDSSSNRLNKQINNSINYINSGNSLNTLKHELKSLKHIDNYVNKPNMSLFYDGSLYQPINNFKPINELLKLFKPFSENINDKKVIGENDINAIINEIIKKDGNKYCLLSKKTKKSLGCYPTKSGAKKREKQVQYFKNVKETSTVSSGTVQGYVSKKDNLEQ